MPGAHLMDASQEARQLLVVRPEFSEHVSRWNILRSVVLQALVAGDATYRADCGSTDLLRVFGNLVNDVEDLFALLTQKRVMLSEVPPAKVPVIVLRLNIKNEHVGEESLQFVRNPAHRRFHRIARLRPIGGFHVIHYARTLVMS